jgi:hypothetical protein
VTCDESPFSSSPASACPVTSGAPANAARPRSHSHSSVKDRPKGRKILKTSSARLADKLEALSVHTDKANAVQGGYLVDERTVARDHARAQGAREYCWWWLPCCNYARLRKPRRNISDVETAVPLDEVNVGPPIGSKAWDGESPEPWQG